MLKSKKIFACIIGLMLIAASFLSTTAYTTAPDDKATNYYDVVNTPEWSKMSRVERLSACQLSSEQLQSLSTDELVQTVLDYPFFVDSRLFNTIREGFLRVLGESTALQELLDREDVAEALIDRYAAIDVAAVLSAVNSNNTCFSELWNLEILLAQPEITDSMNEQQITEMLTIAGVKCEEKSAYPEYQGTVGLFFKSLNENLRFSADAYDSYVLTPNGNRVLVYVWQSSDGDFSATTKQ